MFKGSVAQRKRLEWRATAGDSPVREGPTSLIRSLSKARHAEAGPKRRGWRQGFDQCGQATKGVWGMSWRQEAMKGVEDCDKLGGTVKRVLIPRSPN